MKLNRKEIAPKKMMRGLFGIVTEQEEASRVECEYEEKETIRWKEELGKLIKSIPKEKVSWLEMEVMKANHEAFVKRMSGEQ
jgi:hypothetical protein